jgi:hypothetical protein
MISISRRIECVYSVIGILQPTLRRLRDWTTTDGLRVSFVQTAVHRQRTSYVLIAARLAAGDCCEPRMLGINQRETVGRGQKTPRSQQKMGTVIRRVPCREVLHAFRVLVHSQRRYRHGALAKFLVSARSDRLTFPKVVSHHEPRIQDLVVERRCEGIGGSGPQIELVFNVTLRSTVGQIEKSSSFSSLAHRVDQGP